MLSLETLRGALPHTLQTYEVADGSFPVEVVKARLQLPETQAPEPEHVVVLANGWCENSDVLSMMVREYLRTGWEKQAPTTVVSYTADRYTQADQDETLAKVIRSLPSDQTVELDPHSRGGVTSVHVATALAGEGRIGAMKIIESCGYSEQDLTLDAMVGTVLSELHSLENWYRPRSLAAACALGRNIVQHTIRHPRAAHREIAELIDIDVTEQTVALAQTMPVVVVNGMSDHICPGQPSQLSLLRAGFPPQNLKAFNIGHIDPLVAPHHAHTIATIPLPRPEAETTAIA
ncbi:MAG TPA: hypothetical protein VJR27_03155 [Candidatus Saccharimonadales bacterium]|nr:hypothetical protein [Candidatus Saccharimonadales bacterium]